MGTTVGRSSRTCGCLGQKGRRNELGRTQTARTKRRSMPVADPQDWRREEGEGTGKAGKNLRAHHVRVGRYFVLLDFCRSVDGLRRGCKTVPPIKLSKWDFPEVKVARRFAEVLDPVVEEFGRISVIRGMEPQGMSDDSNAAYHRWFDNEAPSSRLVFLVPSDGAWSQIEDMLKKNPHVRFGRVQEPRRWAVYGDPSDASPASHRRTSGAARPENGTHGRRWTTRS